MILSRGATRYCVGVINGVFGAGVLLTGMASQTQAGDWQRELLEMERAAAAPMPRHEHQTLRKQVAQAPTINFSIPPQPLAQALTQFGRQAGLQVAIDSSLAEGLQSPGVTGALTPEDALGRLLADSGLVYRYLDASTVMLTTADSGGEATPESDNGPLVTDKIVVSAARFERPISELPASVTVLGQQQLDEQPSFQRDPIGGLFKVVPGIDVRGPLGSSGALRGRQASFRINNIEINQRFRPSANAIYDVPPSAFSRVEVVRGADATFGFGASGGAVNFLTSQPVPGEPTFETTLGFSLQPTDVEQSFSPELRQSLTGSEGSVDFWLEVGGKVNGTLFDPDGDPLPDSDSTFPNSNVFDANAAFTINVDDDSRLKFTHFFVKTEQDPEFIALADGDPDTGAKTSTADFESLGDVFDDSFRSQYVGTASYENDDVLGSRVNLTAYYQDRTLRQIPGDVGGGVILQLEERNQRLGGRLSVETPIEFLDDTYFQGSALIWGGDAQVFEYEAEETNSLGLPVLFLVPEGTENTTAAFAQARVPVTDYFLLTGGLRYEYGVVDIGSGNLSPFFGGPFEGGEVDYDQILYNAGLVYFATDEIELYGSFTQAADVLDLARAPRLTNITSADQIQPEPTTTDQFEIGIRGEWDMFQVTAAAFFSESDSANQYEVVPGTSFAAPVRRPQEIWGVEATLDTQPFEDWGFGGSFSFSDGETELDNGETVDLGPETVQSPRFTGYVDYSPFSWWRNRLQVTHQLSADASPELNEFEVDAQTYVDFFAEFDAGPGKLQVGVENLFNTTEFNPRSQINRNTTVGQTAHVPFPGTTVGLRYSMKW